jgi:hypothetical protein
MDISRKQFVEAALGGSALLLFSSCGGGGSSGGTTTQTSSCTPTIGAPFHGHSLVVAVADLDSPSAKTYDIMGSATHNHTVTFSTALLAQLKMGTTVAVTSTPLAADGHTHVVSVTCVIY